MAADHRIRWAVLIGPRTIGLSSSPTCTSSKAIWRVVSTCVTSFLSVDSGAPDGQQRLAVLVGIDRFPLDQHELTGLADLVDGIDVFMGDRHDVTDGGQGVKLDLA